ncbi:hypothetical protein ACFL6I_25015 [candidate division KSB1 bacterium]
MNKKSFFYVVAVFFLLFTGEANATHSATNDDQEVTAHHTDRAGELLERLRSGDSKTPVIDLSTLFGDLNQSGLTPEDIGTTEAELEQMRIAGFKQQATEQLARLRESKSEGKPKRVHLLLLESYLSRGGLTPEDIGTTQTELEMLVCENCEKA